MAVVDPNQEHAGVVGRGELHGDAGAELEVTVGGMPSRVAALSIDSALS